MNERLEDQSRLNEEKLRGRQVTFEGMELESIILQRKMEDLNDKLVQVETERDSLKAQYSESLMVNTSLRVKL